MKYEEFDQQIREMIPQPSAAITDALYRMGVEALEDRPQDLLIAFEFISRYFSVDVLQGVYEIIQHGSAVLPNEDVYKRQIGDIHCHHKLPREKGGNDQYGNLVLVTETIHILIHATDSEVIARLVQTLRLNVRQRAKLNTLRKTAGLFSI